MVRKKRRDDALDRVRTIFWFDYLGRMVDSFNPRQVQRAITACLEVNEFGPIKNNTFLLYSRGDHVPNARIVCMAATLYPESAGILNHVLWEILREGADIQTNASGWVGKMDPDVQKAVLKPGQQMAADNRTINMLMRRPGLDSLALLVILFFQSCEVQKNNTEPRPSVRLNAGLYVLSIFRMLLIIESELITDNVRQLVFDLFVQRVFCKTDTFFGIRLDLDNYAYVDRAYELKIWAMLMQLNNGLPLSGGKPLSLEVVNELVRVIEIPMVKIEVT